VDTQCGRSGIDFHQSINIRFKVIVNARFGVAKVWRFSWLQAAEILVAVNQIGFD
jgi:hypothetical protein